MNIFETIDNAAITKEPVHSRFLADALSESVDKNGDPSLFKAVWELVAPDDWKIPSNPEIIAEYGLDNRGQVDVVIVSGDPENLIVGIEVKTKESSAEFGQLERYRDGLKAKYPCCKLAIAYLTPFNREWAKKLAGPRVAGSLKTVKVYDKFKSDFESAKHASWLSVAEIDWDRNPLWEQHREFVRSHMASREKLPTDELNQKRALPDILGEIPTRPLREFLEARDVEVWCPGEDIDIDLAQFEHELSSFTSGLCEVLRVMIEKGDGVNPSSHRTDKFHSHYKFRNSPFREVHESLFELAMEYHHVWLQGTTDYGLRVAHKEHRDGVSLITSRGVDALHIRGQR